MTRDRSDHRLLDRFGAAVDRWPRQTARVAALLSIPLLGVTDFLSGPEVAFSIFYLVPLSVLGWTSREERWLEFVASVVAAFTWLLADIAAGATYESAWVPAWNTSTRLGVFLIVVTLLANLRDSVAQEQELARLDPLTSIPNGRSFMETAQTEVRRAHRLRHPLTFAYVDIDDFKSINDHQGHAGGDEALRRVAKALDESIRDIDVVGRLGGDEFAILLPETGSSAAAALVQALPLRVEKALSDIGFVVTFSMGSVTFENAPDDVDQMISAADALMYEVKRKGKNSVIHNVYDETVSSLPL